MATDLLPELEAPPDPIVEIVDDSDSLYEVVAEKRVEKLEKGAYATMIACEIFFACRLWTNRTGAGSAEMEILFLLDEETDLRRRPDVCFVSQERWPFDREVPLAGDWEVVPDLAIEVVSPTDTYLNVIRKTAEYLAHGVREVWLVAPEHRLIHVDSSMNAVHGFAPGDTLASPVLPGFSLSIEELFSKVKVART